MKKKFILPAAIAALMGVGGYLGHTTATPESESSLLLANAEALADDDEGFGSDRITCYTSSFRDNDSAYTDCASCTRIEGWVGFGSREFCTSAF